MLISSFMFFFSTSNSLQKLFQITCVNTGQIVDIDLQSDKYLNLNNQKNVRTNILLQYCYFFKSKQALELLYNQSFTKHSKLDISHVVSISLDNRPEGICELVNGHGAVLQVFTRLFEFLLRHLRFCHGLSFLCQQLVFQL